MKIGVFDIGTNSIHLVIADIARDMSFQLISRAKDFTRLGDGSLTTGRLTREKMDRAVQIVDQFSQLARNRGVTRFVGVATAAVREASNGAELLDRIRRETGIKIRPITGEEEARLIWLAVRHFMNLSEGRTAILDIGGGSAELITGTDQEIDLASSYKIGGARLRDLFISKFPVPKGDHRRIHRHLHSVLHPVLERLRPRQITRLIGTSGSLMNIAIINAFRHNDDRNDPHGLTVSLKDLSDLHANLAKANTKALEEIKGLDPERRDTLLPATCVTLTVLEGLGLDRFTTCDKAIREGVILDFIAKNRRSLAVSAEVTNPRLASVLQLGRHCRFDEAHSKHTARLALQLFDSLPLPKTVQSSRELLEYASLLHDVGYLVGYDSHHRHGAYLIRNSDLAGFTAEERAVLASVARFHRKKPPKNRDLKEEGVDPRQFETVRTLVAIVRIADALDRSHFQVIDSVRALKRGRRIILQAEAHDESAIELWEAGQRKDLLESVLRKSVSIRIAESAPHKKAGRTASERLRPKRAATGRPLPSKTLKSVVGVL